VLLQKKCVIRARRVEHGPQLLDFSHKRRLTIRAKESGRSLGLKSSPCKMTWCSRILPVPPCRRRLLLAFLLFAAVKVRVALLGQGSAGKGGGSSLLNEVSALRSQVGEQSGNVLMGDQWLHGVIAYHSGSYEGKTFDGFLEPLKITVCVFAMPSCRQLERSQMKRRHMFFEICNGL
jgi:hypothetical protein